MIKVLILLFHMNFFSFAEIPEGNISLRVRNLDVSRLEAPNPSQIGQFLRWGGEIWHPSFPFSLRYSGTWNAMTNSPDLLQHNFVSGDFLIISSASGVASENTPLEGFQNWQGGDWIVLNENLEWERVPEMGGVISISNRRGVIELSGEDFTLAQLSDVELGPNPEAYPHFAIKFDGDKNSWVLAPDEVGPGEDQGLISLTAGDGLDGGVITTVGTLSVASGGVEGTHLANGSVETGHLTDNAISNDKLLNLTLIGDRFVPSSLVGGKLLENSITAAKVAPLTITGDKIADNAISSSKLANTSVSQFVLAPEAIEASHLGENAVTSAKTANFTVVNDKIADEAIGNTHIPNGSIQINRLQTTGALSAENVLRGNGTWGAPNLIHQECTVIGGNVNGSLDDIAVLRISPGVAGFTYQHCFYRQFGNYLFFDVAVQFVASAGQSITGFYPPFISQSPQYGPFATFTGNICEMTNGGPTAPGNYGSDLIISGTSGFYHLKQFYRFFQSGSCTNMMGLGCRCGLHHNIALGRSELDHRDLEGGVGLTDGATYTVHLSGSIPWVGPWPDPGTGPQIPVE